MKKTDKTDKTVRINIIEFNVFDEILIFEKLKMYIII